MKNGFEVVVVMGSKSDLPVMKDAVGLLESMDIRVQTQIVSAHRTPKLIEKSVLNWEAKGVNIIIAGAGGSAHLPGMIASFSNLPVIGVPIAGKVMNGLDSLLSIVQMPKGIPVATVAVNGSSNAALLALQILALSETKQGKNLKTKLIKYRKTLTKNVSRHRKELSRLGIRKFLKK